MPLDEVGALEEAFAYLFELLVFALPDLPLCTITHRYDVARRA